MTLDVKIYSKKIKNGWKGCCFYKTKNGISMNYTARYIRTNEYDAEKDIIHFLRLLSKHDNITIIIRRNVS